VTITDTWCAHLFRTGQFSKNGESTFPYPLSGSEQERAREYSRDFWRNGRFEKQVRPLSWLVEKFWPVPGWDDQDLANLKEVEVGVPVDVIDEDAVAVAVEVAVAVGELEDSSANSCVPISVSNQTMYVLFITLRTASTEAVFLIVHFTGRSSTTVALYSFQSFSKMAKTILRMSPVVASASAAVNSGNVAMGTVMSVPFSDQFSSQTVGVLSKAIA